MFRTAVSVNIVPCPGVGGVGGVTRREVIILRSALPCLLGIDQEGQAGLNNAGVSVGGEAVLGNDWLCNEDNVAHMTHDWARGDTNHNWQAGH